MTRLRTATASAVLVGLASGAWAQEIVPAAGSTAMIPEKTAPATSLDQATGTTSDKLKQTDGVIKPTGDVDPKMHKPAPQTGTMPVIKPGQNGTGTGGLY